VDEPYDGHPSSVDDYFSGTDNSHYDTEFNSSRDANTQFKRNIEARELHSHDTSTVNGRSDATMSPGGYDRVGQPRSQRRKDDSTVVCGGFSIWVGGRGILKHGGTGSEKDYGSTTPEDQTTIKGRG